MSAHLEKTRKVKKTMKDTTLGEDLCNFVYTSRKRQKGKKSKSRGKRTSWRIFMVCFKLCSRHMGLIFEFGLMLPCKFHRTILSLNDIRILDHCSNLLNKFTDAPVNCVALFWLGFNVLIWFFTFCKSSEWASLVRKLATAV